MTLAVFPTLTGLSWDNIKRPDFKTSVFEALSGQESRAALRQYPKYTFKIPVEHLVDNREQSDLQALMGFFMQRRGMYQAFLYTDPTDNTVTEQVIGIGNGTRTTFQLLRDYGGFSEPVENINPVADNQDPPTVSPYLYKDGVLQTLTTHYTLSATGLVTFTSAPATGVVITWTGSYYYRVRFLEDGYDFVQFCNDFHACADLGFIGSVRNVV